MTDRPFEWQAVDGGLHAIPSTTHRPYPPLPGAEFTTLCGLEVVLAPEDFRRDRLRPMCRDCHGKWRAHQDHGRTKR